MLLTPREKDKLLISMAAQVARRRLERGVKLNHPEAVALITDFIVEGARDGRSVSELMRDGAKVGARARAQRTATQCVAIDSGSKRRRNRSPYSAAFLKPGGIYSPYEWLRGRRRACYTAPRRPIKV